MVKLYLSSGQIWIWFPFNRPTLAKVKALPVREYDPDRRRWLAPLSELDTVLAAFPHATVAPDLRAAVVEDQVVAVRRFVRALANLRVRIVERDGCIVAEGEGVSPVLQEEVDKRAATIRALGLAEKASFPVAPMLRV